MNHAKETDFETTVDTFSGNGSTTAFTLSLNPGDENNTRVFIDGVYQSKSNYAVSGTTLTFGSGASDAPPNGSAIEVEVGFTQAEIGSTLDFADNAKLRLGDSNDLQIYHDGTNSRIADGANPIMTSSSIFQVLNANTSETMLKAIEDGAVELYFDNSKKLETVTGGVTITGTVTATTFSGDLSGTINTATTGVTQSASDNSTKLATTAYVTTALSNLVDSAPGTLNTLNELAAALGDDANFSTSVTNSLATKVGLTAATGAATIPAGTTAQRPTAAAGIIRFNTTTGKYEVSEDGSTFSSLRTEHTSQEVKKDVFTGDGCLMEGISHEVCSLAGTLKLGKLIVFWDDNGISIDGPVKLANSENTSERFKAYGWNTIKINGHKPKEIIQSIKKAQRSKKPTLISCKTKIGFGSPNKQGKSSVHGSPPVSYTHLTLPTSDLV